MSKNIEIGLEGMIEEILFVEASLSVEFDVSNDDEPWAVLINGATPIDEDQSNVYRGTSIFAAVCLAYSSIVGA